MSKGNQLTYLGNYLYLYYDWWINCYQLVVATNLYLGKLSSFEGWLVYLNHHVWDDFKIECFKTTTLVGFTIVWFGNRLAVKNSQIRIVVDKSMSWEKIKI